MATSSSGSTNEESRPAGPAGSRPAPGAGAGAAAAEEVDLTEEDGLYTQHAWARFGFGDWIDGGVGLRLSSPVSLITLAAMADTALGVFNYSMRESPFAGWIHLVSAFLGVGLIAGAAWFAKHLLHYERGVRRRITTVRTTATPLATVGRAPERTRQRRRAKNRRRLGNRRN